MLFRMLKMIATSGFLTALKCTKFVFGRGSARTLLGKLTARTPPDPPTGLRGPTSKGRRGQGNGGKEERGEERGRKGRGNGGEGFTPPPFANSWIRH